MKEVSIKQFKTNKYVKEINKLISLNLKNGALTNDAVLKMLSDQQNLFWLYGFSYNDVSNVDLSKLSKKVIEQISFSTITKFPEESKLPLFYNPKKIIEDAKKNSGKFKVNDEGCCIAIIDNPTQFYLHKEFKNLNYELIDYSEENTKTHFHVDGVLNNICSKNFGYGKNAKYLVYVVDWSSNEARLNSHLKALEDVYLRIKKGEKIQVVSVSNRLIDKNLENTLTANKIKKLVKKLETFSKNSCVVIDSDVFYKNKFQPVYCPLLNTVCMGNYKYSYNSQNLEFGIPINKIMPLFASKKEYKIENANNSTSWAIPVISYFYAVCKKYRNLSLAEFFSMCYNNAKIINKVKIVDFEQVIKNIVKK